MLSVAAGSSQRAAAPVREVLSGAERHQRQKYLIGTSDQKASFHVPARPWFERWFFLAQKGLKGTGVCRTSCGRVWCERSAPWRMASTPPVSNASEAPPQPLAIEAPVVRGLLLSLQCAVADGQHPPSVPTTNAAIGEALQSARRSAAIGEALRSMR